MHLSGSKLMLAYFVFALQESVTEGVCEEQGRLAFDCTKSGFHKIPQNLPEDITTLYLNRNSISRLTLSDLEKYRQLEHLDLSDNKINIIDDDAFVQFYKLKSLYLSDNAIEHLNFFVPKSLETLDVSNNLLNSIKSYFLNSTIISSLDLSSNRLHRYHFDATTFEGVKSIGQLSIDLANNNLNTLPNETIWPLLKMTAYTTRYGKLKLNLNANNIHCNCLLKWIPETYSMKTETARPLSVDIQGQCSSPNNLEKISLEKLQSSQLRCTAPFIVIPNKDGFSDKLWNEGELGSVKCSASGDPSPHYSMVLNHKTTLTPSRPQGRYSLTEQGELRVKDLRVSDSGNVTCIAENEAGIATHVINIKVAPQITDAQKAFIGVGITLFILVLIISVVLGVCIYYYCRRGSTVATACVRKRRSSSVGDDVDKFSLQNLHSTTYVHDPMQLPYHEDSLTADSMTHFDHTAFNQSPVENHKLLHGGDIHSAFVNGMKQSLDRKSKSVRSSRLLEDMNKSNPSFYDLHSSQYSPCSREDSYDHMPMAYARKSNTMPKLATISRMGTFNGPIQDLDALPASQSNPGSQHSKHLNVTPGSPSSRKGPPDIQNGSDDVVLSRPSSTNSSTYSSHTQPYLSIKRGTAMPTVPAKLYAIPLYIDPPQFKQNANGTTIVSPGSTTSEATHMS